MAAWIKIPLSMEVGLGPGDFLLDGNPAPPPQKGASPQILGHVHCGQTAGWIKMALGTEVGLSPGDFVLDGDPAPFPTFRPMSIVAKRLDGSRCHWCGDRSRPRPHCVRWAQHLPGKGHSTPLFSPTVAKRSPISATAELLLYFSNSIT